MSKKASKFQEKFMSLKFRGKEIFKPLNTGRIDEHVLCIREFAANIFFYTRNGQTIMIDAGYNYERLREKMEWLSLDPAQIGQILITHQDTDHVGAVERDSDGLFREKYSDEESLIVWLLTFGDKVEILEPASVRKELLKIANGMKSLYEDNRRETAPESMESREPECRTEGSADTNLLCEKTCAEMRRKDEKMV